MATLRPALRAAIASSLISLSFAAVPTAALAQEGRSSQSDWRSPRISGFDVEQVGQLSPGTDLAFTVYGTPGMRGRLSIEGAARSALLEEVSAGQYRAWYTINSADRITPASRVTVNLRDGSRVATATLDENLVRGYSPDGSGSDAAPAIERFTVRTAGNDRSGRQLVFDLQGTPGGKASVRMRGTQQRLSLEETRRPGHYTGSYALSRNDRLDTSEPFVARLRVGERTVTSQVTADAGLLPAWNVVGSCRDCGTVTAIRPVEVRGDGSYVGPIAGGVLGAVLGNQVGSGSGRSAATVAGAIGGALIGREVERRRNSQTTHYDVVVRMDSGIERTISVPERGNLRVGDPVKINNENVIALDSNRRRPTS